ncbi:MAG: 16S rRNA processing protein RimM [Clostridia bacterium]|nr:16S rRNA processing protein RimM [Clostridia bacterium]
MEQYLEAGLIVNTHGIDGGLMIKSYCDTNEILAGLKTLWIKKKDGFAPIKVTRAGQHRGMVLAHVEGVDDLTKAIPYKNTTVYAKREDLPPLAEGAHYIVDLIGLPVINAESGKVYGTLADVSNTGASDIYEVSTEKGPRYMPAVPEFVREIDLGRGIFIVPIEGMFDEI